VKNNGEAMAGPTDWELWYVASGPPRLGDMIAEGEIPALPSEQEYSIEEAAVRGSGTYQFKVFQRPGHPGAGELWSEDIKFDCSP
jgi:TasA anchoring/assembly protein